MATRVTPDPTDQFLQAKATVYWTYTEWPCQKEISLQGGYRLCLQSLDRNFATNQHQEKAKRPAF
jgi:hypothetical protein